MREAEESENVGGTELQKSASEHVKRYEEQAISAREYAKQHGIKRSTFHSWKQKYGERKKIEQRGKFIEVARVNAGKKSVEVEFNGGIRVKVVRDSDIEVLKKLKEAYGI